MSFFRWLQRAERSLPIIEHPVFGKLEATLINKDGTFFWDTPRSLVTPKGSVGIFVDASSDGPTDAQVALWHWIYENAETLAKLAEPLMIDRLREFGLDTHIRDLVWSAVGLSRDGHSRSPWDMSFELLAEDNAVLTAYFVDGVPTTISFDD